jgi:hypothetical protein
MIGSTMNVYDIFFAVLQCPSEFTELKSGGFDIIPLTDL